MILLAVLIISPVLASNAFAHQVDAVDDYRVEIDWKNWPVVAGEANAIIVYISEMDKSLEPIDQEFISEKGIGSALPLIAIVLLVLANKAIKKDEDLVKSVDRIR